MNQVSILAANRVDFDIFTDNEEKKNNKKRKNKTTSRKLWN